MTDAFDGSGHPPASERKGTVQQSDTKDTSADAPTPMDGSTACPTDIVEQEDIPTPHASPPTVARPSSSHAAETNTKSSSNPLPTIKQEQAAGSPSQPPTRESSIPVPSTEKPVLEAPPAAPSRKRPAPSRTKKGTATATKKAPPAKKRKLDPLPNRSETPASYKTPAMKLSGGSSKTTPLNSSPAASTTASPSPSADDDDDDVDDDGGSSSGDVYCICRKPDNGSFMIGCDGACDDWFHGKCVGIAERDKNLIDRYLCPNCTREGKGHTTWKRMCRRPGCRLPARVAAGGNGGKGVSKYCSDECGVLYFRELVARTRGRSDDGGRPNRQRKGSVVLDELEDLGARGGVLSASEVKSLAYAAASAREFQRLGEEGVLSPPATPPLPTAAAAGEAAMKTTTEESFTLAPEDARELESILSQKEEARRRHAVLKERMKFVEAVKLAAAAAAEERGVKAKEFCGYDSRLEDGEGEGEGEVCERKKCARHLEWAKLAVDSVRGEMGENSDRMRGLEKEERLVRGRGAWRASLKEEDWRGRGWVEVHHLHREEGGDGQS